MLRLRNRPLILNGRYKTSSSVAHQGKLFKMLDSSAEGTVVALEEGGTTSPRDDAKRMTNQSTVMTFLTARHGCS
jgi:hypothetical protein